MRAEVSPGVLKKEGPGSYAIAESGLPGWTHREQKPESLIGWLDTCVLKARLLAASRTASDRQSNLFLLHMFAIAFKSRPPIQVCCMRFTMAIILYDWPKLVIGLALLMQLAECTCDFSRDNAMVVISS